MINIKLLFEVKGARINEATEDKPASVQFQTFSKNEETGELKKQTLKINKEMSEEELKSLVGKTIYCDTNSHNLGEYGDSFSKTYGADDFSIAKQKGKSSFELSKEVVLESVDSVVYKHNEQDNSKSKTVIQAIVKDGLAMDIITISIKIPDEKSFKIIEGFKNKKVLVKELSVFKDTKNFKTYLSSEVIPELIKE